MMFLSKNPHKYSREELLKFIKTNPEPRELKRALAVKLAMDDYSYDEIQETLQVSKGFISKWKNVFTDKGILGLKLAYKGAKSYLQFEEKQEVILWLQKKNDWNLYRLQTYILDKYGVRFKSKQSYYDLFKEAGIRWKKNQKKNNNKSLEIVEQKPANKQEKFANIAGYSSPISFVP